MALSGSRNLMRFAFVRQISEEKLQSNIRLSGGLRQSSEPKEHSVYPH